VPRDYSMALYWFQKAVDGGSADAMNNLGTMYLLGIGVSRDYVNALRWHERSAARGNAHSMYSVAVMADKGLGTARDPQLARAMYLKAAEAGFAPAMLQVSDDYARRSASKHDLIEAYAWLQIAWQSGLPEELQIAALSRREDLEARLGPERRDEGRVRAAQLAALVKTRVLPSEVKAPTPATQSKGMI
jgi:TPR repeat protein